MAAHQPVTVAAMEGLFKTEAGAPVVILGQPDAENQRIDNPLVANDVLSFLIYGTATARGERPECVSEDRLAHQYSAALLQLSHHGGTRNHLRGGDGGGGISAVARRLYGARWMLWILLLCVPLPYIANTAGWMTAEIGRQPWLVYGLMRTADGYSKNVTRAMRLFTLLGFMGLYVLLAILFLFLVLRADCAWAGG